MMTKSAPLLELCEDAAREAGAGRLLASGLGDLLPGEVVVDLFCGAGGWGEGARSLGIRTDFAVNHDPVAIECHRANHPGCVHHRGDAWKTPPLEVVGDRKVGVLFASAACTTHSRARGSAPISARVHMLGWCIARWIKEVEPRIVLIENVPEWLEWGPTKVGADGLRRQDPTRKGMHFRRWWRYCERLGYVMERRVLDAPDYGAPCRRRRLFIIARRDGGAIAWPGRTHGTGQDQDRGDRSDGGRGHDGAGDEGRSRRAVRVGDRDATGRGRHVARAAAEIIDWGDLGSSIFGRPRALKPKTIARIARGILRHVLNDPDPFSLVLRTTQTGQGGTGHAWSALRPLPTQTTRQDLAVATALVVPAGGPEGVATPASEPMRTVLTRDHCGIATPVLQVIRGEVAGRDVREPLPTITAGNGPGRGAGAGHAMGVATPVVSYFRASTDRGGGQSSRADGPLHAVTAGGNHAAVVTPVLMNNTTHHTGGPVSGPLPTVTTGGQAALVAPLCVEYYGTGGARRADEPMGAVVTRDRVGLAGAVLDARHETGSGPGSPPHGGGADRAKAVGAMMKGVLGDAVTLNAEGMVEVTVNAGVYVIVDVLFRMLRPDELARAMGFRADFVWPKTKRDAVRLIGNAVEVRTAAALIGAVLPGRREMRRGVA